MAVVAFVVFLLLYLTPGDPAAILAGDAATSEDIQKIREKLGLDDPFLEHFLGPVEVHLPVAIPDPELLEAFLATRRGARVAGATTLTSRLTDFCGCCGPEGGIDADELKAEVADTVQQAVRMGLVDHRPDDRGLAIARRQGHVLRTAGTYRGLNSPRTTIRRPSVPSRRRIVDTSSPLSSCQAE